MPLIPAFNHHYREDPPMMPIPADPASPEKRASSGTSLPLLSYPCYRRSIKLFSRLHTLFVCFTLLLIYAPTAQAVQPFRIGTGGKTGVYYPIGKRLAMGLTSYAQQQEDSALKDYIGVAQNSAGSIENVQGILSGEIEAGLVQADIAARIHSGELDLKNSRDSSSIRAIASLYAEKFQIVVRKDAGIHRFSDLKGKKISIDEPGSGTLAVMRIVLEAHDMTENDLIPLYLKPVFTHDKIAGGQIDGFVMMAGAPMAAVTDLQNTGVSLVPIEKAVAERIYRHYPFLFPGTVAAEVYPGIPATPTLEVFALLAVNEHMSVETAYALTEMLFSAETSRLLHGESGQGEDITLATALNGISIPLHPGARQFYRERMMLE